MCCEEFRFVQAFGIYYYFYAKNVHAVADFLADFFDGTDNQRMTQPPGRVALTWSDQLFFTDTL
jgi:hypothetical protein